MVMSDRLIVKNIDREVTSDQIKKLFSIHGDVRAVVLKRGRGVGLIHMTSPSEAARARKNLDGEILWGRPLGVSGLTDSLGGRLSYLLNRYL